MNNETASASRLDILGNSNLARQHEVFTATLKQWRQRLGYCSIFAAIPAMLAAQVQASCPDETRQPEGIVAGENARVPPRLNFSRSKPELLKRQSAFRLPHQMSSFNVLAMLGGNDDCPGRPIPGGHYTAAAPFIDSGDTTGANNTVNRITYQYYYYYSWDTMGPDHVYSFTLTSRGVNPQIQVSTSSSSYKPMVYILDGTYGSRCP